MSHASEWVNELECEVDSLVLPAVRAMNAVTGVATISSCQGDPGVIGEQGHYGHIAFTVEGGWRGLSDFCFTTLGTLFREYIDDEIRVDIFAKQRPYAWLNFRHEMLPLITDRLRAIAAPPAAPVK